MTTATHGIPPELLSLAVPIGSVERWPGNPRDHDIESLRRSLREFGQPRPILAQLSTRRIFAGNGLHEAAEAEGWTDIAVTFRDWPDVTARQYLLADNRLHERGSDNFDATARFLADLAAEGAVIDAMGFEQREVDRFLASLQPAPDEELPDLDESDVWAKPGDLFALGDHRLLVGDSTKPDDVARIMDGELAALVMADPPYNVDYAGGSSAKTRARKDAFPDAFDDYAGWLGAVLANGYAHSDDRAPLLLWHSPSQLRSVFAAVDAARWQDRSTIVWNKGSIKGGLGQASKQYRMQYEPLLYCHKRGKTPRWHGPSNESDVWTEAGPSANPINPTMKPIVLYERCLTNHTQAKALVVELFSGSGTTIMACERRGRRARAIEISPRYAQLSLMRWEDATGQKAKQL